MGAGEDNYFFELTRLHHGVTLLDERISAMSWTGSRGVDGGDEFSEVGGEGEPLNLKKLNAILAEGYFALTSLRTYRESLVARMRDVYQNFADARFESLSELREDSSIEGPAERCAFVITAILDSFATQFEEHVDGNNSTLEFLLEFSDELGLPDQAKGDQEPRAGLGAVRLSEGIGQPCNGIRVGKDEFRIVDEVQAPTEFINYIAGAAGGLISEASSSERSQVVEREIFSVSEECEYEYGEAVFPSELGDDRNRH